MITLTVHLTRMQSLSSHTIWTRQIPLTRIEQSRLTTYKLVGYCSRRNVHHKILQQGRVDKAVSCPPVQLTEKERERERERERGLQKTSAKRKQKNDDEIGKYRETMENIRNLFH